ncbi:MAG: hypothetical protein HY051_01920 [Candidatus Aenigmarchaeota archaeon]|nr:hypothetical protein [Candidatus Aenigmarchaeota archaeon]
MAVRVAIAGVGNCASSLVQGLFYYRNVSDDEAVPGLMHNILGGYKISDIEIVAAFDIDARKVGKDVSEAIFAEPNCTKIFADVPPLGVRVEKGPVLDGVAEHMEDNGRSSFTVSKEKEVDVVNVLEKAKADILINYMPVGSQKATEFYAQAAIDAGCAFVNCMPVFIASNNEWAAKFKQSNLPVIGDDVKSQLGATVVHRTLAKLCTDRGVKIDRMYQLNVGGNSVTSDQEIMFLVNGKIRKVKIGEFTDSFIDVYGKKRADGKDIVILEEAKQGIKCFTIDDNYNVVLSNVDALIRHKISGPIYEITTEEGRKIKITGDHNVFVMDEQGDLRETPVKLIKEDETYIAVPRSLECAAQEEVKSIDLTPFLGSFFVKEVSDGYIKIHNQEIKIPVKFPVTDELLQIVGLWLADGNFDRNGPSSNIELACGDEPECMEIVSEFTENLNMNYTVRHDGICVRLASKTLSKIFKVALGLQGNCHAKRVPEWVFNLSGRQIALVLRGYLSGDGGVTGKQIRWTSVSEGLISDVQTLLLRLGINSTIFKETYNENRKGIYASRLGYCWHGMIGSKEDTNLFVNKVGFLQEFKNKALMEAHGNIRKGYWNRVPNISLFKKWRIKSTTWHKNPSIKANIVLNQLEKVKDDFEREKIKNICNGDIHFVRVKEVKQIKESNSYVYDISTKPFERFVCSNILVHNTDFRNMLDRSRLQSKKISKTESVQSNIPKRLEDENIHIGASDYVPWLNDNKIAFIRIEGRNFGDIPLELELRLSVEDSPNSAGVVIDAIRCCKIALDRKIAGPLTAASAYFCKHPAEQFPDDVARRMLEEFIESEPAQIPISGITNV